MTVSDPSQATLADTSLAEEASRAGFLADAKCQESRIDELLTACRKQDVEAAKIWSSDITDPEFKKNLCLFQSLIAGAVGLCARRTDDDFVSRVAELTHRIQLPSDKPLTLPLLLTHRFATRWSPERSTSPSISM